MILYTTLSSCIDSKGILYKIIFLFSGLYIAGAAAGAMYSKVNGIGFILSGDEIKSAILYSDGIGDFFTVLTTYSMYPLGFLLLVYISAFTKAVYPVCGFIVSYRAFYTGYAFYTLLYSPSVSAVYITDSVADIAGGLLLIYMCILSASAYTVMFGQGLIQTRKNSAVLTLTFRFLTVSGLVVILILLRIIVRMI